MPTELEFSTIASHRNLHKTEDEKYKHKRLVKGAIGEEIVFEYLKTYGQKHWIVVRNLWQNYYGEFECDFAIFTGHKFYILEVKNYTGFFTFKDGISKRNGKKLMELFPAGKTCIYKHSKYLQGGVTCYSC